MSVTSAFDWWFRNRETGQITIAQWPNVSFGLYLVAALGRFAFSPEGDVGTVVDVIATGALVWWALDELIRGVNPWRRLLGAGMLAFQLAALVTG